MKQTSSSLPLLSRGSWPEVSRVTALLRKETVGGALLLVATVAALAWANSPWSEAYFGLRDLQLGPAALHLDLSLGTWAADGLLASYAAALAGFRAERSALGGRGLAHSVVRDDAYDQAAADRTSLAGERTAALLAESSQARSRALWRRRMGVRR